MPELCQAAEFAQPADRLGHRPDGKLDLVGRIEPPQAEPQAGPGLILVQPKARRTWLGSGLADVQALPELTASRCMLIISASPLT